MHAMPARVRTLAVRPVSPERWPDLERLFGPRGACAGCWCMWWKLPRAAWTAGKGEGNRRALEAIVSGGGVPGLLAYDGREPVGWVAIEPRAAYARLARARTLKPVDDAPVWSITCFFVARSHRGRGVTRVLVDAAVAHARRHGARLVEGYPVDAAKPLADAWLYTGSFSTFRKAGFEEVARRTRTRPIVRRRTRSRWR
jgi:GNAT superfamily N-acetyltransferase